MSSDRILFFPGCSLMGMANDYYLSAQAVFAALGRPLAELPGWTCCGATSAHALDPFLSVAMPAVNLAKARAHGEMIAVACASCFNRLKSANHALRSEKGPALRRRLKDELGVDYDGSLPVKHLIEIMIEEIGLDRIKERVTRDMSALSAAAYYGCLLVRPPEVMGFDEVEDPRTMDEILTASGMKVVDWPFKVECCGAGLTLARDDVVARLVDKLVRSADAEGADAIVTACPQCKSNLDMRQADARKRYHHDVRKPTLYFTQVLGLAFGLPAAQLALGKAFNDALDLLERRGFVGVK